MLLHWETCVVGMREVNIVGYVPVVLGPVHNMTQRDAGLEIGPIPV